MIGVEFFDLKPKGFFDNRGWAVNPVPVDKLTSMNFGHIHVASVEPGAVRGNHYHKNTNEFLLVFGGEYDFYYNVEQEVHRRHFNDSQLFGIKINTGITHSIKNVGDNTLYVMAYYDRPYNRKNPDTVSNKLLNNQ